MNSKEDYFDFGLWWGKIITSIYGLKDLMSYLDDKDSILSHLTKSKTIKSVDAISGEIIDSNLDCIELFADEFHSEFKSASVIYLNNMIVFQYAIFEQFLEQSVFLFLLKDNNLIKRIEQINSEFRINSSFDLDCLKSTEYTFDIIKSLCDRATKYVITGKIDKSLYRIEKLVGLKYPLKIIEFLKELQNKRNTIVHESKIEHIDVEYFYDIVDIYGKVLIQLERKFDELKINYERPFEWDNVA